MTYVAEVYTLLNTVALYNALHAELKFVVVIHDKLNGVVVKHTLKCISLIFYAPHGTKVKNLSPSFCAVM